jgi:hypothetical protein
VSLAGANASGLVFVAAMIVGILGAGIGAARR